VANPTEWMSVSLPCTSSLGTDGTAVETATVRTSSSFEHTAFRCQLPVWCGDFDAQQFGSLVWMTVI
jgi:hypothetical protein